MPAPPATDAALRAQMKRALRSRMRELRLAVPVSARAARSARIVERLGALPAYRSATHLALFWPMLERGEVDLRALDARARAEGKSVYYPCLAPPTRAPQVDPDADAALRAEPGFRLALDARQLTERGHGFAEPPPSAALAAPGELTLVVVPALAVTSQGQRLGYGAGFYDRLLDRFCPPALSVVVAFDFQRVVELPVEPHDLRCDLVVTDAATEGAGGLP